MATPGPSNNVLPSPTTAPSFYPATAVDNFADLFESSRDELANCFTLPNGPQGFEMSSIYSDWQLHNDSRFPHSPVYVTDWGPWLGGDGATSLSECSLNGSRAVSVLQRSRNITMHSVFVPQKEDGPSMVYKITGFNRSIYPVIDFVPLDMATPGFPYRTKQLVLFEILDTSAHNTIGSTHPTIEHRQSLEQLITDELSNFTVQGLSGRIWCMDKTDGLFSMSIEYADQTQHLCKNMQTVSGICQIRLV